MVDKKCSRSLSISRVFFVGALLTGALALTCPANSTAAPARRASAQSKGPGSRSRAISVKTTKDASRPRLPASFNRDVLMQLEDGQKGLQRQLESLTGVTQRRTDNLARRIDSIAEQLYQSSSAIQQTMATQQLLTTSVRSMQRLLVIIMGLLLVLCTAVALSLHRLKQVGGHPLKDRQRLGATSDVSNEGFEPQWKVSS